MADRRMLTKKVTDDENFMNLSASAQALYLHLSMSADDDGFVNQISVPMFKAHASTNDLESLLSKRFLLQFDNGVIVIKHWRMANALRRDRYTPTAYQEEFNKLHIKDNGSYTLSDVGCQVVANWLPDGCHSIDKDSIDKISIVKDNSSAEDKPQAKTKPKFIKPTLEEVADYIVDNKLTVDADRFYDYYESVGWKVSGKSAMKDWQAAVRNWHRKAVDKPLKESKDANRGLYDSIGDGDELMRQALIRTYGEDFIK